VDFVIDIAIGQPHVLFRLADARLYECDLNAVPIGTEIDVATLFDQFDGQADNSYM
jgi:hypothetical protein